MKNLENISREMEMRKGIAEIAYTYDASVSELTFAFCMVLREDYGSHNFEEATEIVLEMLKTKNK